MVWCIFGVMILTICLVLTPWGARKREVAVEDQREALSRKRQEVVEELHRIAHQYFPGNLISDITEERRGRTMRARFTVEVPGRGVISCCVSGRGISIFVPPGLIEGDAARIGMQGSVVSVVEEIDVRVFGPIAHHIQLAST